MTNIYKTKRKIDNMRKLKKAADIALEQNGWDISPTPSRSKTYKIDCAGESKIASIKTTQDLWFAFKPDGKGGWQTLDDGVDCVVVATVNDRHDPTEILVYMFDAALVRTRLDESYKARKNAGRNLTPSRGMWISLFEEYDGCTPKLVGAGIARNAKPIWRCELDSLSVSARGGSAVIPDEDEEESDVESLTEVMPSDGAFTIAEAKRRLSETLGVSSDKIRITIEA